jgi:hypothetical protein
MIHVRHVALAVALVAAQGCRRSDSRNEGGTAVAKYADSDAGAELAARRELRFRGLDAQLQLIATQPIVIHAMADAVPLTEAGRADVTATLQMLQMRLDEAKNQVALVKTSSRDRFKDIDDKASEAMKKLDDARKAAWDALDKAPRADRSS